MVDLQSYKEYIMNQFNGKAVHFKCDCLIGLDVKGTVVFSEIISNEIIYTIQTNQGKQIKIGENTPGLKVEFL